MSESQVIKATTEDIPRIRSMVNAAYAKYVERMGKPPAPMLADYDELLRTADVFVLRTVTSTGGSVSVERTVGSIILRLDGGAQSVKINNLVVDPAEQGRGHGIRLMAFAEEYARGKGVGLVSLFTNVKMVENFALYGKMGYREVGRGVEDGYERAYFCKELLP